MHVALRTQCAFSKGYVGAQGGSQLHPESLPQGAMPEQSLEIRRDSGGQMS